MSNNIPFKMFANCIPVKGITRSVICDLQRNSIQVIPNDLYFILKKYEGKSISYIKKVYNNEFDLIIEEYFQFLKNNEFVFFSDEVSNFLPLPKKWDTPFEITNAIIDIDDKTDHNLIDIINQLSILNCQFLEIRFFGQKNIMKIIKEVLVFTKKIEASILGIDFILPFSKSIDLNKEINNCQGNERISSFKIYNANKDELITNFQNNTFYIVYSTDKINGDSHCGKISRDFFIVNTKAFTESLNFNSCLNKKISIDVEGEIKNCPSMTKSYGNIKKIKLEEALLNKDFKKFWNITKDQINDCKNCEFRYVCTDCRAYVENPKDMYSKPLKCGYDPYTNKWEEWSANPIKQKAIKYYNI